MVLSSSWCHSGQNFLRILSQYMARLMSSPAGRQGQPRLALRASHRPALGFLGNVGECFSSLAGRGSVVEYWPMDQEITVQLPVRAQAWVLVSDLRLPLPFPLSLKSNILQKKFPTEEVSKCLDFLHTIRKVSRKRQTQQGARWNLGVSFIVMRNWGWVVYLKWQLNYHHLALWSILLFYVCFNWFICKLIYSPWKYTTCQLD